ncbi:SDR family NAD(P)-dependent oxidoreductase [Crossiella sp. NPDC003009]
MPDQTDRTAVVTGASSGLGLAVTKALAARGARVIMAVRNPAKAERIRAQLPDANLVTRELDLSNLDSVRAFAAELTARGDQLDVLVNNAGIGNQPQSHSPQGHELHTPPTTSATSCSPACCWKTWPRATTRAW